MKNIAVAGRLAQKMKKKLYKGAVLFMIVETMSDTPYVILSVPETSIDGSSTIGEILKCSFLIRGVVCDTNTSKVPAKKMSTGKGWERDQRLSKCSVCEKKNLFY